MSGINVCLFERRDWTTETPEKGLTVMEDIPDEFLRKVLSSKRQSPSLIPPSTSRWGNLLLAPIASDQALQIPMLAELHVEPMGHDLRVSPVPPEANRSVIRNFPQIFHDSGFEGFAQLGIPPIADLFDANSLMHKKKTPRSSDIAGHIRQR